MHRFVLAAFLVLAGSSSFAQEALPTVAEASEYRATARHAEVVEFCRRLDESSDLVRVVEVGRTAEGRSLPALVLGDPAAKDRLVVFAMGGIHGGEICGKEALLALARDLVRGPDRALLDRLVVVFLPLYNADGNERVAKGNRPGQVGPAEGMGIRSSATGLDLNRDFMKLEAPETRALVRFLDAWRPAIAIDCHTTNGSRHRYALTYDSPRHPATDPALLAFARDELLSGAGRRLEAETGYASFFYGNFAGDDRWETYPALPRYSTHYLGATHRIGILSEAYAYATFRDRVLATRGFVRAILGLAAEHAGRIRELVEAAAAGRPERIAVAARSVPLGEPVPVLAEDGERLCRYEGLAEAIAWIDRPHGWLVDPRLEAVIDTLRRHRIAVEEIREDIEVDVEVHRVEAIERADQVFEGHRLVRATTAVRREAVRVPAGTRLVRADQPLGTLAALLLEPASEDSLLAWNQADPWLAAGADLPIRRLVSKASVLSSPLPALAGERGPRERLTFERFLDEDRPIDLDGDPTRVVAWLDDDHFLQWREGSLRKVEAETGRSEPFTAWDSDAILEAVRDRFGLDERQARRVVGSAIDLHDRARGVVLRHDGDLWFARRDGSLSRLTDTPGVEELVPEPSPDDALVAFVRDADLHVVALETGRERALTADGDGPVANGWLDWVYEEEVYGRGNRRGYWWSPDSKRIAFLQVDDRPVPRFTILDDVPFEQAVETTGYPRPGEPNPIVRLGVVGAAGGEVRWADLSDYSPEATLLTGVGWRPAADRVWFYAQDRAQTWLDVRVLDPSDGSTARLLREKTGRWVDNPGPPRYLADGGFLLASERTGWRHLYRHAADGSVIGAVTSGPWEVRDVHAIDEAGGWVYVDATRDDPIAENVYRVRLDGTRVERLTFERGSHSARFGPGARRFADTWTCADAPARVVLRRADGSAIRTLDTNPVHALDRFELGRLELVRIPASDGFLLEGTILYPPDFDPGRRYPVWFRTYGGPHAPVVHDAWRGGRAYDRMLATLGFVVFSADPRSASGKGAVSAWTAYRQLGVSELADIETAVRWIAAKPWVDPDRIGISGHSYGGFLTAYAMTHSRLFAAGVAGAPVTDWRLYDTIYTERYMDTPENNREGYDRTSVVEAARNLHGRLLLVHGGFDDNVHVQNTWQLVHELQRHDKAFELMVYPRNRHGIGGPHYQRLVVDFMTRWLRPGE